MKCTNCEFKVGDKKHIDKLEEEDFVFFYEKTYCKFCVFNIISLKIIEATNKEEHENAIKFYQSVKEIYRTLIDSGAGKKVLPAFISYNALMAVGISFISLNKRDDAQKFLRDNFEELSEKLFVDNFENVLETISIDFQERGDVKELEDIFDEENKEGISLTASYMSQESPFYSFFKSLVVFVSKGEHKLDYSILSPYLEDVLLLKSFELRLREVLYNQLNSYFGEDFLTKGIPPELRSSLNQRIKYDETLEPNIKINNPFEKCTINEYRRIIKFNWDKIFKSIFKSRTLVLEQNFDIISNWRNKLHHYNNISKSVRLKARGSIESFRDILGF